MFLFTLLLAADTTQTANSWDNPHEVANELFGAAAVAFFLFLVFFGGNENLRKSIPAIIPGTLFLIGGVLIYIFG